MKFHEITSIEHIEYEGKVYDLEVEEDHSYNIDGIIVHNSDFVMLGSMLSGTDEGGGEIITKRYISDEIDDTDKRIIQEKKFVQFYGMSSKTAQEKHNGGLKDYRSSEGRTTMVTYKGPMQDVIGDILGGVRSTGTYIGARRLKEYPKRATFIRVNNTHNTSHEHITIGR